MDLVSLVECLGESLDAEVGTGLGVGLGAIVGAVDGGSWDVGKAAYSASIGTLKGTWPGGTCV